MPADRTFSWLIQLFDGLRRFAPRDRQRGQGNAEGSGRVGAWRGDGCGEPPDGSRTRRESGRIPCAAAASRRSGGDRARQRRSTSRPAARAMGPTFVVVPLGGPNLLRSQVVLSDQHGELILPIVHGARAEEGHAGAAAARSGTCARGRVHPQRCRNFTESGSPSRDRGAAAKRDRR